MVAVGEHAPLHVFRMITRSHLMMTRFLDQCRNDPDFVDVAAEHEKVTGLTLAEFEAMIIGTHARFGEGLGRTIFKEPGALPLKDRNFAATSISSGKVIAFIDTLSANLGEMYQRRHEGQRAKRLHCFSQISAPANVLQYAFADGLDGILDDGQCVLFRKDSNESVLDDQRGSWGKAAPVLG